ncbi:hypothetical protein BH10PSE7_BH10PSE7_39760 [soil metagenome]
MIKLKTIALAAAGSLALFLAAPATTAGAAPLSPPGINVSGDAPIVDVAQRKWRKKNFNNRRADRRRQFNHRRYSNNGNWGHRHHRNFAWGGYRPYYGGGYYRPYYGYGYGGYRRPYCGYGYGYNCGYGYGYGSPGVNLIFRF